MRNKFNEELSVVPNPVTGKCLIVVKDLEKASYHITTKREVDLIVSRLLKFKEEAFPNGE